MIKNLTIIGTGLIGSSIERAVRANGIAKNIVSLEQTPDLCKEVISLGLADAAFTSAKLAISDADVVIICTPVGSMGDVAKEIAPFLKGGAIVSDVGSVKQSVINDVLPYIPENATFVPAHPIAGTEKSGARAGFKELFEGRWTILTPLENTPLKAIETITNLWEGIGARISIMEPKQHDLILGITSHLPQLISYTLVGSAADLSDDIKSEVIKYSASGFRDFTRIAASDPVMWRDIFLGNKDSALDVINRFTEDLSELKKAIRKGDGEFLEKSFSRTRDIHSQIIKAGQNEPEESKKKS